MKSLFTVLIFLGALDLYSQPISVSTAQTPQQLVNNVLLGFGVDAFNITINGSAALAQTTLGNVAQFTNTNPGFPINNGLLLTTGNATAASGPNITEDSTDNIPPTTMVNFDPTIPYLTNMNIFNGIVLEFDFIPNGDFFSFQYIFGSEEYPEWSPSSFNDAFGFVIGGPGISGPYPLPGYPNGGMNLAVTPNGTTITINSVGPISNQSYYVPNSGGGAYNNAIQYDGTTTMLTASATLECNETYHIKLFIANIGDEQWDSGVFIKGGSFSSAAPLDFSVTTQTNDTTIVEGCTDAMIIFTRPENQTNNALTVNYTIGGSAQQSLDYSALPNPLIFLPGQDSIILNVAPIQDNLAEGCESIDVSISFINPCGDSITLLKSIWICDAPIINITSNNPTVYCATDSVWLTAGASGGFAPYNYSWVNLAGANLGTNDSISVGIAQNDTMYYLVTATDNCNFSQTDTVSLTLNQALAIDTIIFEAASCMPTGFVSVQASGAQGVPQYNWTGPGPNGFIDASVWQNIPSGWYYITIEDSVCAVNDSIFLNALPPAVAQFSANILNGCAPLDITFTNTSQYASNFTWDFGDGQTSNSNDLSAQSHVFDVPFGTYTVTLTANQGPQCSDVASIVITVNVCGCTDPFALNYDPNALVEDGSCEYARPEVIAPNVFSPNADNNNETFYLDTKNVISLQLIIMNRWGNVLMDATSVDLITNKPAWDGKINGEPASEGVYFYKYVATGINNQELNGHGFLHLLKD
jgi:gliding motility-associated-like protein